MTRILIIEDEVFIAEDLAETCRGYGYDVIEPAYNPGDALNKLNTEKVDIILLDINLESQINGLEIADYINDNFSIPFIYISSYIDSKTLAEARNTKPMGYITKPFKKADIHNSIEISMKNFALINSVGFPPLDVVNVSLLEGISKREYELLFEINQGKSNLQLSEMFNISLNTVKSHLKNCYNKLGVKSRVAALSKIRQFSE